MSGRVLVVDDTATNRLVLSAKLGAAYYDVLLADDGAAALRLVEEREPDLILLDVVMPGIDGYEVCRRLKRDNRFAHIPVVMVTALDNAEERLTGLKAGADDFLSKPVNDMELFARVRNLIRMKVMVDELRLRDETTRALGLAEPDFPGDASSVSGAEVMVMTSSPDERAPVAGMIAERLGARVTVTGADAEALAEAERIAPDAILLDHRVEGGDGLRLLSALRARPATRQSAVILVVEKGDIVNAASGLDIGANDYVTEPVDLNELAARLRSQLRRKLYSDRLRNSVRDGLLLAVTDPLTGLYNRRYASRHLDNMIASATASGAGLGVMMLDLDRFKTVNDTHGHAVGDAVLREFTARLRASVRGVDLVARLGGEEFFVAMPEVSEKEAGAIAERIRGAVESTPFPIGEAHGIDVTVSIGVAMARPDEADAEILLDRADQALYRSKSGGRNRVTVDLAA